MFKKIITWFLYGIVSVLIMIQINAPIYANQNKVNIYYFHSDTCYYCGLMNEYFEELEKDPLVTIHKYEISVDKEGQEVAKKVEDLLSTPIRSVPYVIVARQSFVGYNDGVLEGIDEAVEYSKNNYVRDIVGEMLGIVDIGEGDGGIISNGKFKLPFIGEVDAATISLPLLAIFMGTLDGFNPCAMWVLLLLISMLVHVKERWKMWTLGIVFLATSAIMYFFFMLSWLNITLLFGSVIYLRLLIGAVAIGGGAWNLKKALTAKPDDGCEVVDVKERKKLSKRIQAITSEKTFIFAILGIMGLAISVNLVELLCSAGLPIVFTQVLALNGLSPLETVGYLLLYVLFFLIDDLIVFFIAMKTFHLTGLSTKYSKFSGLIGGAIMVILGIMMIFKPEWLMFNF
ncbi:MAG: thioredoxin family protein [Erysipelothrix sp.]|nr:thioredoxin family protein [Erysipelothrix sp.]